MTTRLAKRIHRWIEAQPNWFQYWQLDEALHIVSPNDKTLRRVMLKRLSDKGLLAKHPSGSHGVFRHKKPAKKMDWQ